MLPLASQAGPSMPGVKDFSAVRGVATNNFSLSAEESVAAGNRKAREKTRQVRGRLTARFLAGSGRPPMMRRARAGVNEEIGPRGGREKAFSRDAVAERSATAS